MAGMESGEQRAKDTAAPSGKLAKAWTIIGADTASRKVVVARTARMKPEAPTR
jgi:hypothetical protein